MGAIVRITPAVAVAWLTLGGLSAAGDTSAAIRKPTNTGYTGFTPTDASAHRSAQFPRVVNIWELWWMLLRQGHIDVQTY